MPAVAGQFDRQRVPRIPTLQLPSWLSSFRDTWNITLGGWRIPLPLLPDITIPEFTVPIGDAMVFPIFFMVDWVNLVIDGVNAIVSFVELAISNASAAFEFANVALALVRSGLGNIRDSVVVEVTDIMNGLLENSRRSIIAIITPIIATMELTVRFTRKLSDVELSNLFDIATSPFEFVVNNVIGKIAEGISIGIDKASDAEERNE